MKKIVLSPNWRRQVILFCFIGILILLFAIFEWNPDDKKGSLILLISALVYSLFCFLMPLFVSRFLTCAICENSTITSYLLGRKLCVINTNKTVYYVVFTANEGKYQKRDYIILSNTPFIYPPKTKVQRAVIFSYNMKSQIVLPYEDKTKALINLNQWHTLL